MAVYVCVHIWESVDWWLCMYVSIYGGVLTGGRICMCPEDADAE